MVGSNTIDEFVKTVLETKSTLINQLVEGSALPEDFQRDVMDELRRVMEVLPELPTSAMDEQQVAELLREAGTAFVAAQPAVESGGQVALAVGRGSARVGAGVGRAQAGAVPGGQLVKAGGVLRIGGGGE